MDWLCLGTDWTLEAYKVNKDDIIRMAQEAGFGNYAYEARTMFERFFHMAQAAEREACSFDAEWCIQNHLEHLIPERIRARGKA